MLREQEFVFKNQWPNDAIRKLITSVDCLQKVTIIIPFVRVSRVNIHYCTYTYIKIYTHNNIMTAHVRAEPSWTKKRRNSEYDEIHVI